MIISFVTNCKVWKNKRDKNELDKSMELISCFFTIFRSRHVEKKGHGNIKYFHAAADALFSALISHIKIFQEAKRDESENVLIFHAFQPLLAWSQNISKWHFQMVLNIRKKSQRNSQTLFYFFKKNLKRKNEKRK